MRTWAAMLACIAAALRPEASIAGAGAYLVDDAAITASGRCQIESWVQASSGGQQVVSTLPACSTGAVEWSAGLAGQFHPFEHQESPAVKWQVVDGDHRSVGFAINAGATWANGHVLSKNTYGALTWTPDPARRWSANVDLGEIYDRTKGWRPLVGAAVKYRASEHVAILVEHIHPWNGLAMSQAGIRMTFANGDSVDLIVGHSNARTQDRWLTAGINFTL